MQTTIATKAQTRIVELSLSPPRRLLASLRFRSFKLTQDYHVWEQALAPIRALEHDGWRMTRVIVDWGTREPLTPGVREQATREVTECHGDCELVMHASGQGRGSTRVELEK